MRGDAVCFLITLAMLLNSLTSDVFHAQSIYLWLLAVRTGCVDDIFRHRRRTVELTFIIIIITWLVLECTLPFPCTSDLHAEGSLVENTSADISPVARQANAGNRIIMTVGN